MYNLIGFSGLHRLRELKIYPNCIWTEMLDRFFVFVGVPCWIMIYEIVLKSFRLSSQDVVVWAHRIRNVCYARIIIQFLFQSISHFSETEHVGPGNLSLSTSEIAHIYLMTWA